MPSWLIPSTPFETWLLAMIFVIGNVIVLRLMRFTDDDDNDRACSIDGRHRAVNAPGDN